MLPTPPPRTHQPGKCQESWGIRAVAETAPRPAASPGAQSLSLLKGGICGRGPRASTAPGILGPGPPAAPSLPVLLPQSVPSVLLVRLVQERLLEDDCIRRVRAPWGWRWGEGAGWSPGGGRARAMVPSRSRDDRGPWPNWSSGRVRPWTGVSPWMEGKRQGGIWGAHQPTTGSQGAFNGRTVWTWGRG